jgi:hypothetical protein
MAVRQSLSVWVGVVQVAPSISEEIWCFCNNLSKEKKKMQVEFTLVEEDHRVEDYI